jgi:hypothetical protein
MIVRRHSACATPLLCRKRRPCRCGRDNSRLVTHFHHPCCCVIINGFLCERLASEGTSVPSGTCPAALIPCSVGDVASLGSCNAERDENAENLWQALRNKEYDVTDVKFDDVTRGTLYKLRSPGVHFLMGDSSSASNCLFVRPWADAVYNLATRHRTEMSGMPFCGALVRGTPGIGKSWWLQFVLLCLARDHPAHPVFLESVEQDAAWLLLPNGTVDLSKFHRSRGLNASAYGVLNNHETTYLFDPCGDRSVEPTAVPAFRVVASSPNRGNYKQFAKNLNGVTQFFAPTWELDELLAFAPFAASSLSVDEIKSRFQHYGGVSRAVYARDRGVFDSFSD